MTKTLNRKDLPKHMQKEFPTIHAFRKHKRKQATIAYKAIHNLVIGCAYTPTKEIGCLLNSAQRVIEDLSVKNWGK